MRGISGKVIAITGASSGIGESSAMLLAERGAKVIVGARRSDRLELLAKRITSGGGLAVAHALDVTKREDVRSFVGRAQREFGGLDVLVNNAGVMPLSPMAELRVEDWDRMIDVNIRGVLNGIAAVLPDMQRNGGHIINVASVGAHQVVPTGAVYCATKYAVWAISDGLRQEHSNIRVTTISPGVVATELGHDIADASTQKFLQVLRQNSLNSDAVARAIAYAVEQPEEVDISEVVVRPTSGTI